MHWNQENQWHNLILLILILPSGSNSNGSWRGLIILFCTWNKSSHTVHLATKLRFRSWFNQNLVAVFESLGPFFGVDFAKLTSIIVVQTILEHKAVLFWLVYPTDFYLTMTKKHSDDKASSLSSDTGISEMACRSGKWLFQ